MKTDRLLTGVLLLASAALHVLAAAERWWPACVPGAYESGSCLVLQDHSYDFSPPRVPWEPLGDAAALQGAAWAVLAVAVLLLPSAVFDTRTRRWRAAFAAVAASLAVLATVTAASGFTREVVEVPGSAVVGLVWGLGWPLLLLVAMVRTSDRSFPARRRRLVALGSLLLATPFPQLIFFAPLFVNYLSYDTSPWAEAAVAPFLSLAGLMVLLTCRGKATAVDSSASLTEARAQPRGLS